MTAVAVLPSAKRTSISPALSSAGKVANKAPVAVVRAVMANPAWRSTTRSLILQGAERVRPISAGGSTSRSSAVAQASATTGAGSVVVAAMTGAGSCAGSGGKAARSTVSPTSGFGFGVAAIASAPAASGTLALAQTTPQP